MTAPGNLFEIVTAGLVGTEQPRFWVASPDEAQALIRGAGMVFTVGDLHTHPAEHGEGWAIVRAPVLVGDVTLASEVGELLAKVGKMRPAPWTFDNDYDCGIITYRLLSAGGDAVAASFNAEDFDSLDQAVSNARGVAELRNHAGQLLTRALAEIDRLRVELHARGGR